MSKKKKAAPARKAVKKKAAKKAMKPLHRIVSRALAAVSAPINRTAAATIFAYKVDGVTRIRTSPQRLGAGPGFIEWTVVNLASDEHVDVQITWPKGSPWGGDAPITIKGGNIRMSLEGAKHGIYKYNVTAGGYTEDPEVEIPGN
jgi:hypothetical protein